MMSLTTRLSALWLCALFLFSSIAIAQVPVNGSGKNIRLAYANETPGSAGTIESLNAKNGNIAPVKVIRQTPIPFGTPENLMLDMKGYDQNFVRTFTFQNTSNQIRTITNIDF